MDLQHMHCVFWVHFQCTHTGMAPHGSVARGHGWCSTWLSYQPSLACCTRGGAVWFMLSHKCKQAACARWIQCINGTLGFVSVLVCFHHLMLDGNGILEQQSFLSYQMVAVCICWDLLWCWSESCYWLKLNSPDQILCNLLCYLLFHLTL